MFAIFLLSFLVALVPGSFAEVPSYIHVCGRRNPNLDECILKSIRDLTPTLTKGIKELDVPPSDPLYIDHVTIADTPNFRAKAANLKITGLSIYEVTHLHADLEKQRFEVETLYRKLDMESDYDVSARILVPVAGKGPIKGSATNVKSRVTMDYKLVDRGGKKYVFFTAVTTKLDIEDYVAHFKPSASSDDALAAAINQALNGSRKEIIDTTRPGLEKAISERILNLANRVCRHFTYDELFPDRE